MSMELVLEDGTTCFAERDPAAGWYVVEGPADLGTVVTVDGVRREVVVVARVPGGGTGIQFVPDFEKPGCDDCATLPSPPSPERCRRACVALKRAHWF